MYITTEIKEAASIGYNGFIFRHKYLYQVKVEVCSTLA